MPWTERDRELLVSLTHKVRLLTTDQVARGWWPGAAESTACERLQRLEGAGLLERTTVLASPLLGLTTPVFSWHPSAEAPNYGALSYLVQRRWTQPAARTSVVVASAKAAARFGGVGGRLKRPLQASHDLNLSEVYIHFRNTAPSRAARWVGEDVFAREHRGTKLPDAFLCNELGRPESVVEFAGSYSTERIEAFHEYCAEEGLPYELW